MPVDDPKLDTIWEVWRNPSNRPVEIHTGDPGAFFTPLDNFNERWHELNQHPAWLFHGKDYPKRSDLHAQRMRVIARTQTRPSSVPIWPMTVRIWLR